MISQYIVEGIKAPIYFSLIVKSIFTLTWARAIFAQNQVHFYFRLFARRTFLWHIDSIKRPCAYFITNNTQWIIKLAIILINWPIWASEREIQYKKCLEICITRVHRTPAACCWCIPFKQRVCSHECWDWDPVQINICARTCFSTGQCVRHTELVKINNTWPPARVFTQVLQNYD